MRRGRARRSSARQLGARRPARKKSPSWWNDSAGDGSRTPVRRASLPPEMPAAGSPSSTIPVAALAEGLDRSASRSNNYLEGVNISLTESGRRGWWSGGLDAPQEPLISDEHTSELPSIMHSSYAV